MSSEAELLDAIDADPDDDARRLAHADWLERHGDSKRAASIRESLSLENRDSIRWTSANLPTVPNMDWHDRRGYPEVVSFRSLVAFEKGWPLTKGRHVRHVEFSCLRGGARLAKSPVLSSFASLELAYVEPGVILDVLQAPHLGPLRHLAVGPSDTNNAPFFTALAGLPVLAGLRSLHVTLSGFHTTSEAPIAALVASPHLRRLRELRLEGWLSEEAMRALWRAPSLSGLVVLSVVGPSSWSSNVQPGGLKDLGDGSAMPALERVRLGYSRDGTSAGQAVANATRWTRLRELDLRETKVGDAGAKALAEAPHLERLERLSLHRCQISDAGAVALAQTQHLRALSCLDLSQNVIGKAGVLALGRSERLTGLRTLSLKENPAPPALIAVVEARFREGGPPVEELPEPPAPLPAAPAPDAPLIGPADEDGLLRAIWADPYDDVPRLIYADWLEEQGEPLHAAILRAPAAQRGEFGKRLHALLSEDAPCSFASSLSDEGLVRVSIPVRSLRSKAFERDGPAWLRRHHVAEVGPNGTPHDWAGLFAAGWLEHARGLTFEGRGFDALTALAASPHVGGLVSLTLARNDVRRPDYVPLFAGMRGLCRLLRREYYFPPEAMRALCEAPFVPHLRHLATGNVFGEGLPLLANSPALSGLVTLALSLSGDAELKLLADGTGLTALQNLDFTNAGFTDVGLEALAASPILARLRRLRIVIHARYSPPAVERLARAVAATPRCRLVTQREVEAAQREILAGVLGDRLVVG